MHRTRNATLTAVLSLGLLASASRAGDPPTSLALLELEGPFGSVGERVGVAGDLDGDGVNELLVAGTAGVLTFDGATGAKVHALDVGATSLLNVHGTGDLDGDGLRDVVVADGVSVRAYSRGDGSLLWEHPGSLGGSIGWDLAVLGDVDGDGVDDVAAGEPDADPAGLSSAGTVHVLSGVDGAVIRLIHGDTSQQQVGRSMSAVGDLDRDGRPDVLVGDQDFVQLGETYGRAMVLSAFHGTLIQQVVSAVPAINFAIEVAELGDVNGDGIPDLGVGSVVGTQRVEAYAGGSGNLLWTADGAAFFKLVSFGDIDGDGAAEVLAGAPGYLAFPGSASIIDGATGAFVASIPGGSPGFCVSAAAPGDLTGDGVPEVLIGIAASSTTGQAASAVALQAVPWAVVHSITNPAGGTNLGIAVAPAGDFDGDGTDDVVLASTNGAAVFSGDGGALLAELELPNQGTPFPFFPAVGAVACPGDVDADGVPDYAIGLPYIGGSFLAPDGKVLLLSGATGDVLAERSGSAASNLGLALTRAHDVDGDGVADLYVGAPGTAIGGTIMTGVGAVAVLSGADLSLIATIEGEGQSNGQFGLSVSAEADLTGDGVPELLVGSAEESPGGFNAGRAVLLDGDTHAVLHTFGGNLDSKQVKARLVGDADGDGVADVLTAESEYLVAGENTERGRIRLWSGATFGLLWQAIGNDGLGQFGAGFGGVGDVDGDGYADVAAMDGGSTSSEVRVFSGVDGSELDAFDKGSLGAGGVLALGRFDAGGSDDFLIGIPKHNGNGGARVYASSQGGVHGFIDLGFAKGGAGPAPTLDMYGELSAGGVVTVAARGALPGAVGAWFIGLSAANLPFKKGTLVPSPFGPFFVLDVAADASGEWVVPLVNPAGVFTGFSFFSQFWFHDATATAQAAATNGLQEIFK